MPAPGSPRTWPGPPAPGQDASASGGWTWPPARLEPLIGGGGGYSALGPRPGEMREFARLGAAVTAHPWRVIGAWGVAVVAVLALSPALATFTSNNNSS